MLWGALTVAIVVSVYSPALLSEYGLNDEHTLIRFSSPAAVHAQVPPRPGPMEWAFSEMRHRGRFVPAVSLYTWFLGDTLGRRPKLMHCLPLVMAGATAALLFLCAARQFGSPALGCLLALALMVSPDPGPAEAWYNLIIGEQLGMLFLAGALSCLSRSARGSRAMDWGGLACFVLATLCKESFFLVGPALVFWRQVTSCPTLDLREWRRWLRLDAVSIGYLAWTGIVASVIAAVVLLAPASAHGARSLGAGLAGVRAALLGADGLLVAWPRQSLWFLPCLAYLLFAAMSPPGRVRRAPLGLLVGFALLWCLPQVGIYATRGEMWGRYWYPLAIGTAALSAYSLKALAARNSPRWLRVTTQVLVLCWLVRCAQSSFCAALNAANRTRAVCDACRYTAQQVPARGTVIVVAPPKSEHALAVLHLLGFYGRPDSAVYLHQPDGSDGDTDYGFGTDRCLSSLHGVTHDAVIYLPPELPVALGAGMRADATERVVSFSAKQYFVSLRKLRLVSVDYSICLAFTG